MKILRKLTQFLALVFCSTFTSSYGADFNFSYLFGNGVLMSGSLQGTQNGLFVDNVSNVTLLFNGTPAPGSIFASKFDGSNFVSGPVVSFDALKNNFLFSNSDVANGDFAYDSFFNMLNTSVFAFNTAVAQSVPLNIFDALDLPTLAQNWSLTPAVVTPPGVPDGGVTAAMLGLVLVGMLGLRRKQ